jgi:phage gp46-like protein
MTDIALRWDGGALDFALEGADLLADDTLETAVWISLFSDRRAPAEIALPAGETDSRGWWGDAYADQAGDAIGSLLWLLAGQKQTEATRQQAETWAREALQWLVEDGAATAVEVAASYPARLRLGLQIAITEPTGRRRICQAVMPWPA